MLGAFCQSARFINRATHFVNLQNARQLINCCPFCQLTDCAAHFINSITTVQPRSHLCRSNNILDLVLRIIRKLEKNIYITSPLHLFMSGKGSSLHLFMSGKGSRFMSYVMIPYRNALRDWWIAQIDKTRLTLILDYYSCSLGINNQIFIITYFNKQSSTGLSFRKCLFYSDFPE